MNEKHIRDSMTSEQIQLERKLTCEAIDGAIAFGRQGVNPPPSEFHWLAPYWHLGAKLAQSAVPSSIDRDVIVPLKEPVSIEKALLGGRVARVSEAQGGSTAAFLVNIQLTGWNNPKIYNEGYVRGFNNAAEWMQKAIAIHALRSGDGAYAQDAARYRWLRGQLWNTSNLFVIAGSKSQVLLGTDCPNHERLDCAIDDAMKEQAKS